MSRPMGSRAHDHDTAVSRVMAALARLDAGWTILESPRFGLERPDAVAVHSDHGVCVITVTGLRADDVERSSDGWLTIPDHPDRRLLEQPHLTAERIGEHVYDAHFADLDAPSDRGDAVRWLLVAPLMDDAVARQLLAVRGATDADTAVAVWGAGFDEHVEHAVRGRRVPASAGATEGGIVPPPPGALDAASVRRVLAAAVTLPADRPAGGQADSAPIQTAARSIVADPTSSRSRRLRGVGGSGKTFALTTRAAELARAEQRVLVLSFTTTLADRLTSLIVDRCAERGADPRLVTVTNFHALCEHTVDVAEAAGYASVWPEGARWPVAIVDRARQVIEQGFDHRYDAILVDEGQDFTEEWWTMLRTHFAVPDAEMLVTVDPTQDLYRVEHWFDDETMAALGFADPWIELPAVVRTPPDLVAAVDVVSLDPSGPRRNEARTVERRHATVASTEREQLIGPAAPSVLRWVDIDRVADLGREIGREVVRLVRDHPTLTPGDVVFLCDYHHDGLAAVREIERAGIPVHHQFSRDPAGRSVRRRRFSVGSPAVKGATVHGFKGWEAGALVMGIGADATSVTLASVAVERVATPTSGGSAIVTVVNADRSRRPGGASLNRSTEQAAVAPTAGLADRPAPEPNERAVANGPLDAPLPPSPDRPSAPSLPAVPPPMSPPAGHPPAVPADSPVADRLPPVPDAPGLDAPPSPSVSAAPSPDAPPSSPVPDGAGLGAPPSSPVPDAPGLDAPPSAPVADAAGLGRPSAAPVPETPAADAPSAVPARETPAVDAPSAVPAPETPAVDMPSPAPPSDVPGLAEPSPASASGSESPPAPDAPPAPDPDVIPVGAVPPPPPLVPPAPGDPAVPPPPPAGAPGAPSVPPPPPA